MNTEDEHPLAKQLAKLKALDFIELMCDEAVEASSAVRTAKKQIAAAIAIIAECFKEGGSVLYVGAGTSGRLGAMESAEMEPTFGVDNFSALIAGNATTASIEGAEDDTGQARRDFDDRYERLRTPLVVVGISAAGSAPYVVEVLRTARDKRCKTIAVANNRDAAIFYNADVRILLDTGPEIIAGSTRLKAGTAQKICLNAIGTGAMLQCGRVRNGMMSHMTPTNEKLRRRAVQIVMASHRIGEAEARKKLEDAAWDLAKTLSE